MHYITMFDCFSMCFPKTDRVYPASEGNGQAEIVKEKFQSVAETPQGSRRPPIPIPAWVDGMKNSAMDPTDDCRYYCPLCMMYFECVYEAKCCGHSICDECAAGLLDVAAMNLGDAESSTASSNVPVVESDEDSLIPEASFPLTPNCTSTKMLPLECPFCRNDGLALKVIEADGGDHLRNYEDSPVPADKSTPSGHHCEPCTPNGSLRAIRPSPLKVGDSFEKMMSKMIPLEPAPLPARPTSREGIALPRPSSREALRPASREAVKPSSRPSSREALGSAARPPKPPARSATPVQMVTTPARIEPAPQLEPAPVPSRSIEPVQDEAPAPTEEVPVLVAEPPAHVDEAPQDIVVDASKVSNLVDHGEQSLPGMANAEILIAGPALMTPQRMITSQTVTTPLGIEPMHVASNAIVA